MQGFYQRNKLFSLPFSQPECYALFAAVQPFVASRRKHLLFFPAGCYDIFYKNQIRMDGSRSGKGNTK